MKTSCPNCYISLVLFLFLHGWVHAQSEVPYRLTVESGGSVQFKVNTFQYYNQGIDYTDWTATTLRIYCDTLSSGQVDDIWYLGAKTQDSEFLCNYPDQSLPLNYVKVRAATGSSWTSTGETTLNSSSYTALVRNGDEGSYSLDVEYRLDSTLGRHPGYYTTNFIFRIDTTQPSTW